MAARTMRRCVRFIFRGLFALARDVGRRALRRPSHIYNCNVTVGLGKTALLVVVPPTTHTLEGVLKHVSLRSDEESARDAWRTRHT